MSSEAGGASEESANETTTSPVPPFVTETKFQKSKSIVVVKPPAVVSEVKVVKQVPQFLPDWAKPPWPEWSDQAINREVWEENESIDLFEDPSGEIEVDGIQASHWIRPSALFPETPQLVDWTVTEIDILNPNVHICELSDLVRFMLSEISELYEFGVENDFHLEGEGTSFVPNSERQDVSWKPWDHIYSCCKAGVKGDLPSYNPVGKYYVRLYFMGCWRRIAVDDRIPLLRNGRIGLPISSMNELWPLILVKALLKISSLTWEDGENYGEMTKFSAVSALTGWVYEWIDVRDPVSGTLLWNELLEILPKYKRPVMITSRAVHKYNFDSTLLHHDTKKPETPEESDDFWWSNEFYKEKEENFEYHEFSDPDMPVVSPLESTTKGNVDSPPAASVTKSRADNKHRRHKRHRRKSLTKTDKKKHLDDEEEVDAIEEEEQKVTDTKDAPAKNENKSRLFTSAVTSKAMMNKHLKKIKNQKDEKSKKNSDKRRSSLLEKHDEKHPGKEDHHKDAKKSKIIKEKEKPHKGKKHDDTHDTHHGKGKKKRSLTEHHSIRTSINASSEEEEENEEETKAAASKSKHDMEDKNKANAHPGPPIRTKVPLMQEILQGIHKYAGFEFHSLINHWEAACGKDIPVALTVVLKIFPKPEESGTMIPSFLYHPMQLIELRDVPLYKSDRPPTPLWKTFRWKAWAMKKGIIPMESDKFRCVKLRTPFVLKTDWQNITMGSDYIEYSGEDGNDMRMIQKKAFSSIVSLQQADTICGGGNDDTVSIIGPTGTTILVPLPSTTASKAILPDINPPKNDEEEWEGEFEGEGMLLPTSAIEEAPPPIVFPKSACGSVWFECDTLAPNIRKFCKYYSSRSAFGSTVILKRSDSDWSTRKAPRVSHHKVQESNTKFPRDISNYHAVQPSHNLTIKFDVLKILDIKSYHLDPTEGQDAAYYLFSDCWTEQEIIITVEVLQAATVRKFSDRALHHDGITDTDDTTTPQSKLKGIPSLNVNLTLEPWDWRKDCCVETPLIYSSTSLNWSTHLTLPPGRNTFRLWLTESFATEKDGQETELSKNELKKKLAEEMKNGITPFVVRLISKTPISVGTREEIQNYMTNEPVLFLKQCERVAYHIWTMFLLFGKNRSAYIKNLKKLRKCYCPSFSHQNFINKRLKPVHFAFDNYFVSMIIAMNNGKLDRPLLFAFRCLLLNPMINSNVPLTSNDNLEAATGQITKKPHIRNFEQLGMKAKVEHATVIIQKFCRGWMVRRLFQIQVKTHKGFLKMEYQIRKIAYFLARHTNSPSVHNPHPHHSHHHHHHHSEHFGQINVSKDESKEYVPQHHISPTLIPNPPKWAINLLKNLLKAHPLLVAVHSHAYCLPHHLKIREIEGNLPTPLYHYTWLPFLRQQFVIGGDSKWCYIHIGLQVRPSRGVYLKIINNDTGKRLINANSTTFLGKIKANELGYTLIGYRWVVKPPKEKYPGRNTSTHWKIRIITSNIQDSIVFKDEIGENISKIPRNLTLQRFTGYYVPNVDFSICRYTMETPEHFTQLSIRFRTNFAGVRLRLQIWDLRAKTLVYERAAVGGFLLPSILIESIVKTENIQKDPVVENVEQNIPPAPENPANETPLYPQNATTDLNNPTTPAAPEKPQKPFMQRYGISIFVDGNSWILNNKQWIFVHNKRRKFFKKIRKFTFKSLKPEFKEPEKAEEPKPEDNVMDAKRLSEYPTELPKIEVDQPQQQGDEVVEDVIDDILKKVKKKKKKDVEESETMSKSDPDKLKQSDTASQPSKVKKIRKTKRDKFDLLSDNNKDGVSIDTKKDNILPDKNGPLIDIKKDEPVPEKDNKSETKSDADLTKVSTEKIDVLNCIAPKVKKLHKHEVHKQLVENLTIASGGKNSHHIHHPLEPHWLLEIVTDTDKTYNFTSNRQEFKHKLHEIKHQVKAQAALVATAPPEEPPPKNPEVCKGIFLMKNLCHRNYKPDDSHAFVDPISHFYNLKSCPDVDNCSLDYIYDMHDYMKCLQHGWKKLSKMKMAHLPKKLKKSNKKRRQQSRRRAKKRSKREKKLSSYCRTHKVTGISYATFKRIKRSRVVRKRRYVKLMEGYVERVRLAKIARLNAEAERAAQPEKEQPRVEESNASDTVTVNETVITEQSGKTGKTRAKRETNSSEDKAQFGNIGNLDGQTGKKKKKDKEKHKLLDVENKEGHKRTKSVPAVRYPGPQED